MPDSKQLDELLKRAQTNSPDDELLPLIMPEDNGTIPPSDESQANADDEELDGKSARRRLLESFADDEGEKSNFSIPYVLSGEVLTARWWRKQLLWLILLVILAFAYVSNRYYAQKQQIAINRLKNELKEKHYDAMARSSELMRNCRRSTILEILERNPDNALHMPDRQPAVIKIEQ